MKIKPFIAYILLILAIYGCSSGLTIANIGIPGGAKDASTRDIGNNKQLVYMTSGNMSESCDAQTKLITAANWKTEGSPSVETTYQSSTFSDGTATLTLMCSEERDGGNLVGTKVTMTLQGASK